MSTLGLRLLFVSVFAASVAALQNQAALRIVVIEGDNAVNIIQQKTAVAPVVEVRDRNDLPVAGVPVSFTVSTGNATFVGGLQTVTVTTNAAGRAAVTALNPVASGSVRVSVSAVFQGQTATAVITQTNVMTAAQAAAAGAGSGTGGSTGPGSAAGGGAGSGGGGLSVTTLGIVGAAAAGGTLLATQVLPQDEAEGPVPGPGPVARTFTAPLSGDLLLTFPALTGGGCTRVERGTGTLRMELSIQSDNSVTGTAQIPDGFRVVVVAVTCSGGPQLGQTDNHGLGAAPVTGTTTAMSFSRQDSNTFQATPSSPIGTNTVSWTFSGALSGEVITGTLRMDRRIETPGIPAGTGSVTFDVTLQRS